MSAQLSPRVSPAAFRRLALASVVVLSAIIVTGGAVRLTDSGLGCPDWPSCTQHRLVAALSFHPMVEFANRVFTGLVVVAVLTTLVGALLRSPRQRDLTWLSAGLVAGVVAQVVLGGFTVLFKLAPPLVMAHFLLSLAVLTDALVLHRRAGQAAIAPLPVVGRELVWLCRLMVGWLAVVLAAGTVVTGAGPHAGAANAPRLQVSFRDAAELHASLVMVLVGLAVGSLFALRQAGAPAGVQHWAWVMIGVMAAQAGIGYAQYLTRVPALLVGLHIAGATALWIVAVELYLGLWSRPPLTASRPEGPRSSARALTRA